MKRSNVFTGFSLRNKKFILLSISCIIILSGIYLIVDYRGPNMIKLKPDTAFGFSCMRARELIVQEYDKAGNLWASRGMIIYKMQKGDNRFVKVTHVPTGFSIFWLRNFKLLRKLTVRPECIEMVTTGTEDICTLSAGSLWHLASGEKKFRRTFQLDHYGFGDQGFRNDGIVCVNDSLIFFGEYFYNTNRTENVKIFKSTDGGRNWSQAFEFQAGEIRHIHALQNDPFTGYNWVCTGDSDEESMIGWSYDNFKTITYIGQGSQIWRVCQLVFTEEYVYWGADQSRDEIAGIYRWDRETKNMSKVTDVEGAIFFGISLSNGTMIFSTDRDEAEDQKDDKTRIYVLTQDSLIKTIECGTWKHKKPGFRFKYALLRFQRDQGGPSLAVTVLNQKEFPDGELLIIPEDTLVNRAKQISD